MAIRYGFFFDASACTGCKACQMACKDRHDLAAGLLWRRVYEVAGGGWRQEDGIWVPSVVAYNVSLACNHCQNPACALSCPVKAISRRDDGIVLVDAGACIGCRYCEWACPYGALRFDPRTGAVSKCTFCHDDIDAGGRPACVAACPQRALDFGDLAGLEEKHGRVREIVPLPAPGLTDPALVIRPHRDAGRAAAAGAAVANWEEV
ncbi:MAG TPA: dimethylsulfoxide reductase subunit B [Candidatus Aminicenantes bacterium]|nr:dimethylsulfoxide reductase subunit B [Candidatus Aminicenantes bacterium]HRY65895.1 dimethylsulfoxide reductase subunit B [Candidatus Aminicenantes bacterium]HRZ72779.1 dimethylsulfoxide reductase subunit B [Candidatus Aminicenantes bacterium]